MIRFVASGVILLGVAWVTLHFFTKVGTADVVAYNEYTRMPNAGLGQLLAGDVVAVYADDEMERICDLNVDPSSLADSDRSASYVNTLAESLPLFETVAGLFRRILGIGGDESDTQTAFSTAKINFTGAERSLREVSSAPTPDACLCRVAKWLSQGTRVCTVNSALVETRVSSGSERVSRTLAVHLARHVNFVFPEVYEQCGVEYTAEAKIAEQQLCNDGSYRIPFDAMMRRQLNLIDERPFSPAVLRPAQ